MGPSTADLVVIFSCVFALLPVLACYACRWWLDRGLLEPPWMFPLLFVSGGVGGLVFGIWGYDSIGHWYHALYGPEVITEPLFGMSLLTPTAEELGKALILLPLLVTRWFRGPVDGLIYGLAAGAGFACVENFVYFADAFQDDGTVGWAMSVIVRAAPSAIVHGCCTAAVGAFLGAAYFDARPWVVGLALICGFVAAIFGHGLWNWFVWIGQVTEEIQYYQMAMLLLPMMIIGFALALTVAQRIEMNAVFRALAHEVEVGRLTPDERDILVDRSKRRQPDWWPMGSARRAMIATALELGFLLHRCRRNLKASQSRIDLLRNRLRGYRRTDRLHREASMAEAASME